MIAKIHHFKDVPRPSDDSDKGWSLPKKLFHSLAFREQRILNSFFFRDVPIDADNPRCFPI